MKAILEKLFEEYIKNYQLTGNVTTHWGTPLLSYADANDKLFFLLKDIVGQPHALPSDFLMGAKTVISYFIPFHRTIIEGNIGNKHASKEWAKAYIETNQLINDLNLHIKYEIEKIFPGCSIVPAYHSYIDKNNISNWSQRHVAFIAGLGKFGLNNMLITDIGCCGRIGSLITNLELEPTIRNEQEYCLFKLNGSCALCVDSCVNDALHVNSFDSHRCNEMCMSNDMLYSDLDMCDVCGKCIVGVPCSTSNPNKL